MLYAATLTERRNKQQSLAPPPGAGSAAQPLSPWRTARALVKRSPAQGAASDGDESPGDENLGPNNQASDEEEEE